MDYEGCIEAVEGGEIIGWCIAGDRARRARFISVFDGDQLIGTAKADIYRADLLDRGGDGHHGFSFPVPDRFTDGLVRVFSVFAGPGLEELPGSPVRYRQERAPQTSRAGRRSGKQNGPRRAAIVCWNLSHNPIGRAHVLYKLLEPNWSVEIVSPIWRRFGSDLWAPLRNEGLSIRSFQPADIADLWREGARIALTHAYDLVIICKPRLPGLILGLQIAEQSRCPIVVDIDEDDRAFTTMQPRADTDQELFEEPFGKTGTDMAYRYLHVADSITLSNPSLLRHFSGRIIRHARDEAAPRMDRKRARQRFGFADADFVIGFVGSARPHKGLSHVLSAMRSSPDRTIKLLLAGSIPAETSREISENGLNDRVVTHDLFDLSASGNFLAASDLVPVLQDLDVEITKTQMPAKFTDALQYGLPIVATDAPPFHDMVERGVVDIIKDVEFAQYLARVRAQPARTESGDRRRRLFEEEFSFSVNRPRLALAIKEAAARFDPAGAKVRDALRDLLSRTRAARAASNGLRQAPTLPSSGGRQDAVDIAFFWKQNDSGLFGRRSDMVVKYLLKTERVGRIVHFDQLASMADLRGMANAKHRQHRNVASMQLNQTLGRALELSDEQRFGRRLFIRTDEKGGGVSFAGRPAAAVERYTEFVDESLRAAGLDPGRTIAWVCPVVSGFLEVNNRLRFRKVIVDLIDDQRTWSSSEADYASLQSQYESTLRAADLVFTNCEGNRQRFSWARADIVVVPNGAEVQAPGPVAAPEQLSALRRPIVGYVGNLRERIDWELVRDITSLRPSWSVVMVGPVEDSRVPEWVRERPNLFLPGPIPYEESHAWIGSFDVAIMPHMKTPMTEAMNPLKLYNYLAAGTPVVATAVANIDELADLVAIADSHESFVKAIDDLLSSPRASAPNERLESFSWARRVEAMLREIDGLL